MRTWTARRLSLPTPFFYLLLILSILLFSSDSAAAPVTSWEGMFNTDPLIFPPDTHGASGPYGVIAVVNSRITYYNKDGTIRWGPVRFSDFMTAGVGKLFDPRAIYDPLTSRFFVLYLQLIDRVKPNFSWKSTRLIL